MKTSVGADPLAGTIGWTLAATIALIGLDEFNLPLGFFTLKPALLFFSLAAAFAVLRLILGGGLSAPHNLPGVFFCFYILITSALYYLGHTNTAQLSSYMATASLTRCLNLITLIVFTYLGSQFVTPKQLYVGTLGMLFFQVAVFFYCVWLLMHGEIDKVSHLPGGLPRFAPVQGGLTINQMGAMWLVPAMVFCFLQAYRAHSAWQWLPIVVAGLGAISSFSRSMMIGLAVLAVAYTLIRGHLIAVFATLSGIAFGIAAFIIYQSQRIVDASALERLNKWSAAWADFEANLLFGSGFGTNPSPHSVWFQLLSETGLVGFLLGLIATAQLLLGDGSQPKKTMEFTALLFLPYLFYLSVDIPILQWQTWVLAIAVGVGYRHFGTSRSHSLVPSTVQA